MVPNRLESIPLMPSTLWKSGSLMVKALSHSAHAILSWEYPPWAPLAHISSYTPLGACSPCRPCVCKGRGRMQGRKAPTSIRGLLGLGGTTRFRQACNIQPHDHILTFIMAPLRNDKGSPYEIQVGFGHVRPIYGFFRDHVRNARPNNL